MESELLIKPGFYRHYKGKLYHVLGVAQHSETQELYVVYTLLYEHSGVGLSIRPLEMFTNQVDNGSMWVSRFVFIGDKL